MTHLSTSPSLRDVVDLGGHFLLSMCLGPTLFCAISSQGRCPDLSAYSQSGCDVGSGACVPFYAPEGGPCSKAEDKEDTLVPCLLSTTYFALPPHPTVDNLITVDKGSSE